MHTPDGFLDHPVSVCTGVVAVGVLATALRRARVELLSSNPDGSPVDVPGRVTTVAATTSLIFALQMLNFPVMAGASGHLLGGALAAVLLGPWLGALSLAVVLTVQAPIFADGGLASLGTNIVLMAVVGLGTGWAITRALTDRPRARSLPLAAGAGALASVPAAALAFVGLYAVGGTKDVPLGALTAQMVGVHLLIGIGEALVTTAVVAAALALAPTMVFAARRTGTTAPTEVSARVSVTGVGVVALMLAGALTRFASPHPDGMEFVATNLGLDATAGARELMSSPVAGYGAAGGIDIGAAGVLGVLITAAVTVLLLMATLARRAPSSTCNRTNRPVNDSLVSRVVSC